MNKELLVLLQDLYAFEDKNKLSQVAEYLTNAHFELRGKLNPDLQLSASGLVFVQEKLFFVEHPYQKEWLLPAGHVELDETPLETAIREFHEETGYFAQKKGKLVDVNVIKIPFNAIKNEKAHLHIDFRFLLELTDESAEQAELPTALLSKNEAPLEFRKYFKYKKKVE